MNSRLVVIVIVLGIIAVLFGQNPPPTHPAEPALRGRVHDTANNGLPGVVLKLYSDCADPERDTCIQVVSTTSSETDGSFSLGSGLKAGAYGLHAKKEPFLPMLWGPVNIPRDRSKPLDLVLPPNRRNETGQLQLSPEEAKEVFAAAKADRNYELVFLTSRLLQQSTSTDSEKQFYSQEAAEASTFLIRKIWLKGVVRGQVVFLQSAKVKAANRLTGETFEVEPSTDGTFFMPVTGVGTYDLFLTEKDANSGTSLINNLTIDTAPQTYTFAGGSGSVSVQRNPS